jgi:hypothetical protein
VSDYSRVNLFAKKLLVTDQKEGEIEKALRLMKTHISLDPTLSGALLTARILCETLGRLPGQVMLYTGNLSVRQVKELSTAYELVKGFPPSITDSLEGNSDLIKLHIGTSYQRGVIRAIPEGYGGRIIASAAAMAVERPANALGSVYTASLAAAEVFKIATNLSSRDRAPLFDNFAFCPVTLSDDLSLAADLPDDVNIDLAILGLGAIGSAVAVILSEINVHGRILLVDNQRFSKENLATYSLGTRADVEAKPWKVNLASHILKNYSVTPKKNPAESLPRLIDDGLLHWPDTVISALDTVESRYAAQLIWPDNVIDPATGDTMVGIRTVNVKQPCLMCLLSNTSGSRSSVQELATITGLSEETLKGGDNLLSASDTKGLSPEQKAQLKLYMGKPICGLADAFGLTGSKESYRPSIPFASQQAACLAVGRLIGQKLGIKSQDNLIQYDVFRGPENATRLKEKKDPECYCSERADTIEAVRRFRRKQSKTLGLT